LTIDGNAKYSRPFFIVMLALIVFSVFTLLEAAEQGVMTLIITATFLVFTFFLIIIMHGREEAAKEAFFVPFILFLANTLKSFLTGNYSDYLLSVWE